MVNFLIPSDCSEAAFEAMKTAILLGQKMSSRLYFIHAMADPVLPVMTAIELRKEIYESQKKKHQEELESKIRILYADLKVRANEAPYECIIVNKPLNVSIPDYSSRLNISLIVMGTSGASGFRKIFRGSNTSGVIKKSSIPVLVIPSGFKFEGFKKIAFALDIDKFEQKESLSILTAIIQKYNATLDCFYILPKDDSYLEAKDKLVRIVSGLTVQMDSIGMHIKETEPIAEALEHWLKEHNCDLVALIPREWTLGKLIFSVSMTEEMTHRANLPLLILP